jgi:hypothetical protein
LASKIGARSRLERPQIAGVISLDLSNRNLLPAWASYLSEPIRFNSHVHRTGHDYGVPAVQFEQLCRRQTAIQNDLIADGKRSIR